MEYRFLGKSGLRVSALSFGSWVTFGDQMDTDKALACMRAAYDAGVNFFDNAEVYAGGQARASWARPSRRPVAPRGPGVSTKISGAARAQRPRSVAQAHGRGHQRRAPAPAGGPPRPLLLPSAGPEHADRGDRLDDEPPDHPGQGAVLGHQRMERAEIMEARHSPARST